MLECAVYATARTTAFNCSVGHRRKTRLAQSSNLVPVRFKVTPGTRPYSLPGTRRVVSM